MIYSTVKVQLKKNLDYFLLENRMIDKKIKLTGDIGLRLAGVWYITNRQFLSTQEMIWNRDKIQLYRAQRSTT